MEKTWLKINKGIASLIKKFKSVGVSIAIFNNSEIIDQRYIGYQNKAKRITVNESTLFMIGSNTKILTGIAIMKLYEEHKLSLDDDIRNYIPDFSILSRFDYDKITITDLLAHRSGLPSDLYDFLIDPNLDFRTVVSALKETYLTAVPGTMFSYSNLGYALLGIIIEKVSGLKYDEYLDKILFNPLKMNIKFLPTKKDRDEYITNLSLSYDNSGKEIEDPLCCNIPAGSNTYATLSDGIKLTQLFLNKGQLNGIRILSEETIEKMMSLPDYNYWDEHEMCGGYGLLHHNYTFDPAIEPVLGHGGDTIYHHSVINFIPKANTGIVIYTNSSQGQILSRYLMVMILSYYLGDLGYDVPEKLSVDYDEVATDVNELIGKYVYNGGIMDIKLNKKNQLFTTLSNIKVILKPCEDGYYQCLPTSLLFRLIKPIKQIIMGNRLKKVTKNNETILLLESTIRNQRMVQTMGKAYQEVVLTPTWEHFLGTYKLVDERNKIVLDEAILSYQNKELVLTSQSGKSKNKLYLQIINEKEAIVQGFGRSTGNTVTIKEVDNKRFLCIEGIDLIQ